MRELGELEEQCWQSSVHPDEAPAKRVELLEGIGGAANAPFWVCTGGLGVAPFAVLGLPWGAGVSQACPGNESMEGNQN
jgi:hypothetical protein